MQDNIQDLEKKLAEAKKDVKQRCVEFVEWCMKNKYTYYFNGEKWMWANAKKQEYYTTEELYNKCFNNNVIMEQPIDESQITEVPLKFAHINTYG